MIRPISARPGRRIAGVGGAVDVIDAVHGRPWDALTIDAGLDARAGIVVAAVVVDLAIARISVRLDVAVDPEGTERCPTTAEESHCEAKGHAERSQPSRPHRKPPMPSPPGEAVGVAF